MAGAILGTCLGGPVGFLAGVKIGGLAAVGGSIFGRIIYTMFVNPVPIMNCFLLFQSLRS